MVGMNRFGYNKESHDWSPLSPFAAIQRIRRLSGPSVLWIEIFYFLCWAEKGARKLAPFSVCLKHIPEYTADLKLVHLVLVIRAHVDVHGGIDRNTRTERLGDGVPGSIGTLR